MEKYADEQLIGEYLNGDEKALETLIGRYLKPIYGFVYGYAGNVQEAEDITQEVFLKAWRNLKKFDPQKSFKTWLFAVAKNTAIDFLRKKRTIPFSAFDNEEGGNDILDTLIDPAPLASELAERAEKAGALQDALGKISPKSRKIVSLYHDNQLNFREIAQMLGESLNTVKSRYRRAMVVLRKLLTEKSP
jgi:RNA polymerase sigma-70 factor (ECF subfamily)